MSQIMDIADAVVDQLNGGTFSEPFTAQRRYLPEIKLTDTETLQVLVVAASSEITSGSREVLTYDYAIDVAVLKKLTTADAAEVDPLMDLVEEIADALRLKRLEAYPEAVWVETLHDPIFIREHFDDLRQFTSVLRITYRVMR